LFYDEVDLLLEQLGGLFVLAGRLSGCPSVEFENQVEQSLVYL
jgi:hypothetical protein